MADFALLRESRRHVVGIRSPVEVCQVAAGASRAGQVVIAVDVTLRALHVGVGAGQWESCCGVIERRSIPRGGAVAGIACLRESGLYVIRIRGALVILQVARRTRSRGQTVISIHVTLRAL